VSLMASASSPRHHVRRRHEADLGGETVSLKSTQVVKPAIDLAASTEGPRQGRLTSLGIRLLASANSVERQVELQHFHARFSQNPQRPSSGMARD